MAFNMDKDGVSFHFLSDFALIKENGYYKAEIMGKVPVPELKKGDRLLLPINEGIALKAEEEYETAVFDISYIKRDFCTHEATMSMIIVERAGKFLLITLESGVHSSYEVYKENGIYQFSIINNKPCNVYYQIFDDIVSACKAHRKIKKKDSVLLTEKVLNNPNINNLIGGGIFWVWNENYDEVMYSEHNTAINPQTGQELMRIAGELKDGGIDKALFGIFFEKDSEYAEKLYKAYGYIATQYDNYNDVLNPALLSIVPTNRVKNCDYTARRMKDYPDGIAMNQNGEKRKAWALKGFDGQMYSQNCLCPLVARDRMKQEVAEIIEKYPFYKGRFIDVYGVGLSACYNPAHPVTLDECLQIKKTAFGNLKNMGLIAGTEDGFEDLIDTLDYSEGLHSPVAFRNRNSGRRHANMYNEDEQKYIEKYMLNPACRVPLWQMVYHECMLTFPYWGDSTDDCIGQIKDKILFACLYGCPPLYSFSVKDFEKLKEHILFSYKKITAVHQKVATLPMTDYQVLTDDYLMQTTVFGNKYRVVANFSSCEQEYEGKTIPPKDFLFSAI